MLSTSRQMASVTITEEHLRILREHRILTRWYQSPDVFGSSKDAGWFRIGTTWEFRKQIEIEPYCGIYAGPYEGSLGIGARHGFCSVGTQSYSYSALPEGMTIGRYCSIANRLKVLDSQHPSNPTAKPPALLERLTAVQHLPE